MSEVCLTIAYIVSATLPVVMHFTDTQINFFGIANEILREAFYGEVIMNDQRVIRGSYRLDEDPGLRNISCSVHVFQHVLIIRDSVHVFVDPSYGHVIHEVGVAEPETVVPRRIRETSHHERPVVVLVGNYHFIGVQLRDLQGIQVSVQTVVEGYHLELAFLLVDSGDVYGWKAVSDRERKRSLFNQPSPRVVQGAALYFTPFRKGTV